MDYISTVEAAERWGVSVRYIQRLLHDDRIPGAKKFSGAWLIPADAQKPHDPRNAQKRGVSRPHYIFLTTTPMPKRSPDAALLNTPKEYRALAAADLAYRRGDTKPAKEYWRQADRWDETKLSAASLATAAAISSGDYELYFEIDGFLNSRMATAESDEERALLSLPKTLAAVSMAAPNMTPEWLKSCDFSLFPTELTPFLLYLYALHLRNSRENAGLLYTARAAALLCAQTNTFTWLDLHFLILAATASFALGDEAQAKKYLSDALALGMPCGFIMPFADALGAFGGLLERMLDEQYPDVLGLVTRLWSGSFTNWMDFHNKFTKENITTILTAQEYQAAHLMVHGATYKAAAARMSLSVSRIKNILSDVYGKLYIQKQQQLQQYIL